jgi:hypothetical protein
MAKPVYEPKLDALNDVQKAVEDIWADLMAAKHAMHFLQGELEEDWSRAVSAKADPQIIDTKSARTWLSTTVLRAVDDADVRLCYLINNIPDEARHA